VVPYSTGGTADLVTRSVGDRMSAALGVPVVPDYRPGANLMIGAQIAATAPPDGRTLFLGTGTSHSLNPLLRSNLSYRPEQLVPVIPLTENAYIIVVPPDSPGRTLAEFIALAKTKQGGMNYGTFGAGNINHLGMELLAQLSGVTMNSIPYRVGVQSDVDLLAGRLDVLMTTLTILPHIQSGAARALAVTTSQRYPLLPGVPTVAEQGFPGYDVRGWFALFAPAGTPDPLIARYNAEANVALRDPWIPTAFAPHGLTPLGGSAADLGAMIAAENARWAPIIQRLGLRDQV
jgi:tripartite-type tricarboxylate transporter receptor subunit TctC